MEVVLIIVGLIMIIIGLSLGAYLLSGGIEHWQDVRERAAIAAMQGLLCAPSYEADRDKLNMIATDAVSIADIEELKKK